MICATCVAASPRRTPTCASTTRALGSTQLEADASRPDLWDDPDKAQARHHRDGARPRRRRAGRRARRARLRSRDALRARPRGGRRLGRRRDRVGCAAARRRARSARAARAVHRRSRRARRDLRSALRRGRNRRAGLGRHAAAHVHALGAAGRLRGRARRTQRRHRSRDLVGDVHREGSLRVRDAAR